ncbi:MAG: sporulation protein YqfD [Oscillospiraceae bacterium]|nr:sporulation protein YqfD [Oscillospiraceae bacterium]
MVQITAADIPGTLTALNDNNIILYRVIQRDMLTVEAVIGRNDHHRAKSLLERLGGRMETVQRIGIFWRLKQLKNRPILIIMLLAVLLAAFWLPGRIFFVRVEGNAAIPQRLIMERAEECGISFGASRQAVRSEKMKNALLAAIPDLKWAGVNTYGCVAVISVTERSKTENSVEADIVSSIVASRDGIITECTVIQGSALCKVGQAVKKGEKLVSGYTDCGFKIRAQAAEGEIYAMTKRSLRVILPQNYGQKGSVSHVEKKYSMIFGKNKINFSQDSGISPAECDKMYLEYYLMLPGGFQLPVALVVEEWICYENRLQAVSAESAESSLSAYAASYLDSQMISGTICSADASVKLEENTYILDGEYTCREMIGRSHSEEIIQSYGEND